MYNCALSAFQINHGTILEFDGHGKRYFP